MNNKPINQLAEYIDQTRSEFREICLRFIEEYRAGLPSHPGKQKRRNGLAIHTIQVVKKALELNQEFEPQEIIETCLAHDLKHWETLPLHQHQTIAILATKGLRWEMWRKKTQCYRFVVLILIADMWSAYLNILDKN